MREDYIIPLQGDLVYLLPTAPSFWRWTADGQWLEWADGKTIAHWDELLAVLERLAPRGLPQLETIVLVLAATKPHWDPDRIDLIAQSCAADAELPSIVDSVLGRSLRVEALATLVKLESVAALPGELRSSAAAKASLIDFIFNRDRVISPATAEQIVLQMRRGIESEILQRRASADALKRLANALHTLDRALDRVSGDAVELWQRSGIDFDLTPADISVPPARQARDLLRVLRTDEELGGLARIAADVLAAMRVPRALSPTHDTPAGGVSDLSNKGSLDQLLVSELAHDDMTLAVRVAMGEALYLRREPPARHPPVGRWIVIDSGIRLWGTGRLFATAVGLALAASSDERAALRVFRANGDAIATVSFASRSGVTNHLSQLVASPDPLPALRLAAQWSTQEKEDGEQTELILVTHEQTAADPGFLTSLSAIGDSGLTVRLATVTAEGAFTFSSILAGGRTEISRARFSIERLAAHQKATPRLIEITYDASLPMFLRLKQCPLLLPARVQPSHAAYSEDSGVIGLSADRRLMQWSRADRGPQELSAVLPAGIVRAVLIDDVQPQVHVVIEHRTHGRFTVSTLNLQTLNWHSHEINESEIQHAELSQATVLLIGLRRVLTVSTFAAAPGGYAVPPGMAWQCGRFFKSSDHTIFVATPTGLVRVGPADGGLFYFDHVERGPVRMRTRGHFEPFADGEVIRIPEIKAGDVEAGSAAASIDGRRIIAHEPNKAWFGVEVDAAEYRRFPNRHFAQMFLLGKAAEAVLAGGGRFQLLHRVGTIARRGDGSLVIRPESTPRAFSLDPDGTLQLIPIRISADDPFALRRPFEMAPTPPGTAIQLRKATWDDGSTAWLDTRGLLHLMSSDSNLPQVTLVLRASNHRAAGWLSTGEVFGEPYFAGRPSQTDDRSVWALLLRFGKCLR